MRLDQHRTVTELGNGLHQLIIQRGQNYFDRDAQAYLETPFDLLADDRSAGFSHVHKGAAWKRIGKGGLHRAGFGRGQDVTYLPVGVADVAPMVEGNVATYHDLWPSVDVRLTVSPEGIKEDLILRDPAAAHTFAWDVIPRACVLNSAGEYIDPLQGRCVGRIAAATVHDAAGVPGTVTLTCTAESVALELDRAWMDDPARVYPVTVDPSTTIQPDGTAGIDTYVTASGNSNNYGNSATLDFGDWSGGPNATRTLQKPDISGIPAGASIISASFSLYLTAQGANPLSNATLHRITGAWTEGGVTWANQPTFDATAVSTLASVPGAGSWAQWTGLASLVQGWLDGTYSQHGILIKKRDGENTFSANDYRTAASSDNITAANRPKWEIAYAFKPTPTSPTGTSTSPGSIADDLTPRLSWSNAVGVTQSKYQVQVADTADNLKVDSGQVSSANAYYDVAAGAGLVYGTTYKWRVQVYDGSNWTGYTDWQYFRCTINPPTNLTVTPDADHADIDLSWTASAAEGLGGYGIMRKIHGVADAMAIPLNLTIQTGTTYTDDTAACGTSYDYAVYCVTTNGTKGANSSWVEGAVTFTDPWVDGVKVTRELGSPQIIMGRNASYQVTLTGRADVVDAGYSPRQAVLSLRYETMEERQTLIDTFPSNVTLSYRDPEGEVLRGKVTGFSNHRLANELPSTKGFVTVELTEVKADV